MKFTLEQKLIILTSRLTISNEEVKSINAILNDNCFNWFEFAKLALYHKTLSLCFFNIQKHSTQHIPKYLREVSTYIDTCTRIRNESYQKEIKDILKKCEDADVTCIPVKGSYLIPLMYKNYGVRFSGDMDFLVKYSDTKKLITLLNENGYMQGNYKEDSHKVEPLSREEKIKWKLYLSNLAPFYKLSKSIFFPYYKLDFRFALDNRLDKKPINEIVDFYVENGYTRPAHYLVHMCCHLYNEAKYNSTIWMAKDLNLIKFCDIREYMLHYVNEAEKNEAIRFSKDYCLEKSIYFAMYYLNLIYSDGYENQIMDNLNVQDKQFLNSFGEGKNDESFFKRNFWERFFSCNNKDELASKPSFFYKE